MRDFRNTFTHRTITFPDTISRFLGCYGGFEDEAHNSLIVHWQTEGHAASNSINYRVAGETEWAEKAGEAHLIRGTKRRQRIARLNNLNPDTVYEVRFNGSIIKKFKTMPATFTGKQIKILFISDTGSDVESDLQYGILQTLNPDIIIISGDISHADHDLEPWKGFWDGWFQHNQSADGITFPIIAQYGNHDIRYFMDMFFPHTRGFYGYTDIGDYLTILNLVSDYYGVSVESQNDFIEAQLIAKTSRVVVPCWHVSPYAAGIFRTMSEAASVDSRTHWTPIFTAHDNVYFAHTGHSHVYAYTPKVTGDEIDPNGKRYFGQGAGFGASIRDFVDGEKWFVEKVGNTRGGWLMTLKENELKMQSYDLHGNMIDEVLIFN